MKLKLPKGTKDYLPDEQILREQVKNILKRIFERYGYAPLKTPILEMKDVLASKYAGGAEILKEMFTLKDQGNRELALRYDLTVPLARVIGMNPELRMPFKRYEIGRVFRDGPIKLSRYRSFTQCDADVVGTSSMLAEAELLALTQDAFKELKLDVRIEINNRTLLNSIIDAADIPKKLANTTILSIDKLTKIGRKGVEEELINKGVNKKTFNKLFTLLESDLATLKQELTTGINEIDELNTALKQFNVNVTFTPSLARGLEIYTGTIFEVFLNSGSFTSALAAGGRYDQIIGKFVESNKECPAVGISFGLDAICDAIQLTKPTYKNNIVDAYLIPIRTTEQCVTILQQFRNADINTDMDTLGKSISKNLDYVNKASIPYAIIIGQQELEQKKVKVKNMSTGTEQTCTVKAAIKQIAKGL